MSFLEILFLLVVAHMIADYPLQGPFLSEAKNRNTAIGKIFWMHALPAHSLIQAGGVFLVTQSLWMALSEAFIHGVTDWMKCEGKISLNVDQLIHLTCKVIWAALTVWSFA